MMAKTEVWLHECYRVFSDRLVMESDAKELSWLAACTDR